MRNIWPSHIRLHNDTTDPSRTDVLDADTGAILTFVMEATVRIDRQGMAITAVGATDDPVRLAVVEPPDPQKGEREMHGVVVERHTYYVTRLDVEGKS